MAGTILTTLGQEIITADDIADGTDYVRVRATYVSQKFAAAVDIDDMREAGWAVGDQGIVTTDSGGNFYTHVTGGTPGAGYATLTDPAGAILGVTALVQLNTYDLTITIDGVPLGLITSNGMVAATITAALASVQANLQTATGSTETCALVDGRIEVRSATTGVASNVIVAPGTGNDLIAALNAALTTTLTVDAPVDGVAVTPVPQMIGPFA